MREYSSGRLEGGVGWKVTFSEVQTSIQCPSQEGVCLKESQLKRSKERQGPTLGKTCLWGVNIFIEVT